MNLPSLIHCRLDELELPGQVRPDEGEHEAAVGAVVLEDAGGQRRAVVGAAPDHAVQPHLAGDDRVAGVHPPGVRADRALEAPRVVAVQEGVVALWVGAQLRVVLVRGQGERRAARPAPDELGGQPLLLGVGPWHAGAGTGGRPPRAWCSLRKTT